MPNPTQGTLAHLDTANPAMYIDFPNGCLKLLGTLVFPRNKYMVLKPGSKDILAEDILESMVRRAATRHCQHQHVFLTCTDCVFRGGVGCGGFPHRTPSAAACRPHRLYPAHQLLV